MKLDARLENALNELIKSIQESDEYISFEKYRREAKKDPELRNNIYRTRKIRSQLGKMSAAEKNGDSAEYLLDEYDHLMDNTAVHHFSVSEHEFCEMYQIIMSKIAEKFDLDV